MRPLHMTDLHKLMIVDLMQLVHEDAHKERKTKYRERKYRGLSYYLLGRLLNEQ